MQIGGKIARFSMGVNVWQLNSMNSSTATGQQDHPIGNMPLGLV